MGWDTIGEGDVFCGGVEDVDVDGELSGEGPIFLAPGVEDVVGGADDVGGDVGGEGIPGVGAFVAEGQGGMRVDGVEIMDDFFFLGNEGLGKFGEGEVGEADFFLGFSDGAVESGFAGFYVATNAGAPIGSDFLPAGTGEEAEVSGVLGVIEEEDDGEGLVYGGEWNGHEEVFSSFELDWVDPGRGVVRLRILRRVLVRRSTKGIVSCSGVAAE